MSIKLNTSSFSSYRRGNGTGRYQFFKLCFAIVVLLSLSAGCQNQQQQEVKQLQSEVMLVHDRTMEKMGYMYELETSLQQLLAQKEHGASGADQQAVQKLQKAQAAMMQWMHKYVPPKEGTPYAEQMTYLLGEKQKIIRVEQLTTEAIRLGESLTKAP